MGSTTFKPGNRVPWTGIYRVEHDSDRLMHMATLLATDRFPRCKQCGSLVRFTLERIVRKAVIPFRPTTYLEPVPLNEKRERGQDLHDAFTALELPARARS